MNESGQLLVLRRVEARVPHCPPETQEVFGDTRRCIDFTNDEDVIDTVASLLSFEWLKIGGDYCGVSS